MPEPCQQIDQQHDAEGDPKGSEGAAVDPESTGEPVGTLSVEDTSATRHR
jgi:hypothetical protein